MTRRGLEQYKFAGSQGPYVITHMEGANIFIREHLETGKLARMSTRHCVQCGMNDVEFETKTLVVWR